MHAWILSEASYDERGGVILEDPKIFLNERDAIDELYATIDDNGGNVEDIDLGSGAMIWKKLSPHSREHDGIPVIEAEVRLTQENI